jgi:hypothetical protein
MMTSMDKDDETSGARSEQDVRRRAMRKALVALVVLFVLTVLAHRSCGPFWYSSDPIKATVIDEESGRPLEGAVVVAVWVLDSPWYTDRPLHSAEALTDEHGVFFIPAMARTPRPWLMFLTDWDPLIYVYKPGYEIFQETNFPAYVHAFSEVGQRVKTQTLPDGRILIRKGAFSDASRRFCFWNGKTLPLKRHAPEDFKAQCNSLNVMYSETDSYDLTPRRFPVLWGMMLNDFYRLPREVTAGTIGHLPEIMQARMDEP